MIAYFRLALAILIMALFWNGQGMMLLAGILVFLWLARRVHARIVSMNRVSAITNNAMYDPE